MARPFALINAVAFAAALSAYSAASDFSVANVESSPIVIVLTGAQSVDIIRSLSTAETLLIQNKTCRLSSNALANLTAPRRRAPRWVIPNVRKKWYFAETGSAKPECVSFHAVEVSAGVTLPEDGPHVIRIETQP